MSSAHSYTDAYQNRNTQYLDIFHHYEAEHQRSKVKIAPLPLMLMVSLIIHLVIMATHSWWPQDTQVIVRPKAITVNLSTISDSARTALMYPPSSNIQAAPVSKPKAPTREASSPTGQSSKQGSNKHALSRKAEQTSQYKAEQQAAEQRTYPQKISLAIQRQQRYSAGAIARILRANNTTSTRGIIMISLSRDGTLTQATINSSTGITQLDNAILQAAQAASPLPAPPRGYLPHQQVIEFLIPLTFSL